MSNEQEIILADDARAAQLVNLDFPDGTKYGKGWVSLNRRFYTNEAEARNDSATHFKCECGDIIKKGVYCQACYSKRRRDKYLSMPLREYSGGWLVLHDDDKYFDDECEVREWCAENDTEPESLMLVICEPNYLWQVDADYWGDITPEDSDGDLPKEVEVAPKALNEVIKKQKPYSWSAGGYRTTVSNIEHVPDTEFERDNG